MPTSWNQQKANLRTAINAGRRPRLMPDGRQIISTGQGRGSFALLTRPDGSLTRAGQFYFQETQRQRPNASYDPEQPVIRRGPTDYIRMRDGNLKALRTLQPTNSYRHTRLGQTYYRNRTTELVAHIPVLVTGVRQRGRRAGEPYSREDYLPANVVGLGSSFTVNEGLSPQDQALEIKASVLSQWPALRTENARLVLHEESDESYVYDRDRGWKISSMTTSVVNDELVTETRLRRPLGVLRQALAQLPSRHTTTACASPANSHAS